MRLFLASFEMGNHPERLTALVPPGTRASIVVNALDNLPRAREEWLARQRGALEHLGFIPEELDLRNYFGSAQHLATDLVGRGLIWINGGNAFLLRRAMRQSGFDSVARVLVESEEVVYGGFSAAVCCAAPTLRGIDLVDDPSATAAGYTSETVWEGLGLIDYNVAVHHGSLSPQGKAIESSIAHWKSQKIPYITLRDDEVLVVDRESVAVVR